MGTETIKPSPALFFTWDVSLALWKEKGLLDREVRYYEALADRGVHVTFLTWGNNRDSEIAKSLHKNITVIPLYTHIPQPKNKVLRAFLSLLAPWAARDVLKTSDILKTNQMWGGWCAVLSKFCFRKPLIVRTGFELYRFTCQKGHGCLRRAFIRFISAVTYKTADRVYLATAEDRDFVLRTFHIPESKISIRPNWIDTSVFRPLEVPEKDEHILFVGRLTAQKNLPLLIEAIAGMPWTLDIVGEGELWTDLEQYARQKGVRVNFLGSVSNSHLPEIYNSYPVFVLPSLYEGNPKALLEAMACGRAAIGTDADGIRTVIQHRKNGLLCDPAVKSLQDAINNLLSDKNLRTRLGAAARAQIIETQTLEKLIDQELLDYYALAKMKE